MLKWHQQILLSPSTHNDYRFNAMGEWQELIQTVVLGLIFSYLVAKLISTVVHFREENLTVVREEDCVADEPVGPNTTTSSTSDSADDGKDETLGVSEERLAGSDGGDEDEDDDDDWEGVESTELDEVFSAATTFVAATAADRSSKVPNEVQLQLYGLYKIATEGPCTVPQPSALKMTARAKWNAWKKLGAMPPEEAMEKYIEIVTELYPSWGTGSATTKVQEGGHADRSEAKGPVGPVFSSFIHEEGSDNESKLEDVHVFAREGKVEDLIKFLDDSSSVNLKDSEGRTPLHWAVDRGHFDVVKKLISNKADTNAKDNEGQTPLHYAALCEREAIAEFLVQHEADCSVKDNDGNLPSDLGGSAWSFMSSGN